MDSFDGWCGWSDSHCAGSLAGCADCVGLAASLDAPSEQTACEPPSLRSVAAPMATEGTPDKEKASMHAVSIFPTWASRPPGTPAGLQWSGEKVVGRGEGGHR